MAESACDEIDEGQPLADTDSVHASLRRLAAANFKGTFQAAYSLLTEMTKKIGWDQLLKVRSQVFVMEEEYRTERKTKPMQSRNASTVALNGSPAPAEDDDDRDDDDNDEGDGSARTLRRLSRARGRDDPVGDECSSVAGATSKPIGSWVWTRSGGMQGAGAKMVTCLNAVLGASQSIVGSIHAPTYRHSVGWPSYKPL